jgi:uncharacterized membrane protein
MKRYEEHITIEAPPVSVYDYVSDFTRHGEWAGHELQVTMDGEGPAVVGTRFSTVAKQFGTQREHSTITELSPGAAFGWESEGTLGTVHHRFTMSAAGESTALAKSAEFVRPSFLAKVFGFRLNRDVPAGLRSDLDRIKAHLEAGSG